MDYILFIVQRMLSGVLNGLFYASSPLALPFTILFMGFTAFFLIRSLRKAWPYMKRWKHILSIVGVITSVLTIGMVSLSFLKPLNPLSEIHLWTFANQTAVESTLFLHHQRFWGNLVMLLLAISPAAFLQKLFINIIPGGRAFYSGTDDNTGRTWGFTLFKRRFRVPRLGNMKVKLVLALLCVLLYVVHHKRHKYDDKIPQSSIRKGA